MKKSLKSLFKKKKKVGEKVSPEFERAGGRQTLSFCLLVREEIALIVNMINAW